MSFDIDGRTIGPDAPCFVIAEAGVNHNGDLSRAINMIDAALEMGADAIKFQTFNTENLVTIYADKATYQKYNSEHTQYKMLKRLELSAKDFYKLANYSRKQGLIFLSTAFDFQSVDLLYDIGIGAFKIGSGDLTDAPLLRYIASKKKPIILSSGMSTLDEIEEGLNDLKVSGCKNIVLLHCTSSYPTEIHDANLLMIKSLKERFHIPIGFSDHTQSTILPAAAVSLGAVIIEKHFTLDRNLPGPDHKMSLEPVDFREMIQNIRHVEEGLGDGVKRITSIEQELRNVARKSVIATMTIKKDSIITRNMLTVKRPGTGIKPRDLEKIIGLKAKNQIEKNELVKWEDLIL